MYEYGTCSSTDAAMDRTARGPMLPWSHANARMRTVAVRFVVPSMARWGAVSLRGDGSAEAEAEAEAEAASLH